MITFGGDNITNNHNLENQEKNIQNQEKIKVNNYNFNNNNKEYGEDNGYNEDIQNIKEFEEILKQSMELY